MGELEAVAPNALEVVQAPHRLVVVLYGNPLSGTSVQAAALCSRYGLPCVSVDSLLQVSCWSCRDCASTVLTWLWQQTCVALQSLGALQLMPANADHIICCRTCRRHVH